MLTELCTNVDEKEGAVGRMPSGRLPQRSAVKTDGGFRQREEWSHSLAQLTLSTDLRKLGSLSSIAPSSNGKAADSGQSSAFRVLRALLLIPSSVE